MSILLTFHRIVHSCRYPWRDVDDTETSHSYTD